MEKRYAKILKAIGLIAVISGFVLPPAKILALALPAQAAFYFNKLLWGVWCLKIALILNGLILVYHQALLHYLWQQKGNIVGQPLSFSVFSRFSGKEYIIFFIVLTFAVILRGININQSLFGDEIVVQRMFISRGIPVILTYFPYTPQHVMYSLLAFFSQKIPLPIEISYRLPAALASIGTVALSYIFARNFFPKPESILIMFLNAISPFAIIYSQVAKSYSFTAFFVLAYLCSLLLISRNYQKRGGWLLLGFSLFTLLYMHVYNGYLVVALVALFIIMALRLKPLGHHAVLSCWIKRLMLILLYVGALLFLLYSLQLPQILEQFTVYRPRISSQAFLSLKFFKGWLMHLTFWGEHKLIMYLCLCFSLIGLVSCARRKPNFAIMLVVPCVTLLIVYLTKSFIFPRYFLFTLPFFLILLVEGVASVGQFIGKKIVKSIALGTLAIIFTLSTATVLWKYYKIGHQNVKGACRFVSAQALSQDTLVSFGAARDLFPFYEGRVIAAKTKADLENALKNASGNVYLLYGYERVLRTSSDFNFIKNNFRRLKVFDGMYMDSDCRDGEIFVEIAEKK